MFDFRLTTDYSDTETLKHIKYSNGKKLTGTLRYSSINAHLGIEQSRRDYLESLGFVLVYMIKGKLPWQGLSSENENDQFQQVLNIMLNTRLETLCSDLPCIIIFYYS